MNRYEIIKLARESGIDKRVDSYDMFPQLKRFVTLVAAAEREACAVAATELRRLHAENKVLRKSLEGVMYWDNGKPEWDEANDALRAALTEALAKPVRKLEQSEREAFEAYALQTICNNEDLQQRHLTEYGAQELNYLWRGWRARASLQAAQPVREPEQTKQLVEKFDALQPKQEPVAWMYWQSCLNDDGTQTAPWVQQYSKFKPQDSRINRGVTPLYAAHQPHPYDQQALELCEVCGWKTLIPGDGCLNCERKPQPKQEPVAYITRNEEGDPSMLFFDHLEAESYCAEDEDPEPLYATPQPHLKAMQQALDALHRVDAVERGMVTTKAHHYAAREETTIAINALREVLGELK